MKNDFALQQEAIDAERLSLGAPERLRGVTLIESSLNPSGEASAAAMWANLWSDYRKENLVLTAQNKELRKEVQELRARVEKLSPTTSRSN